MKKNVQRMCVTAILLALATVLSLLKPFPMPFGGSVTLLSMLPIVMLPLMYGTRWGIVSAFIYSLIQLGLDLGAVLSWGLTPYALIGTIVLDYLLAFTLLGFAGIFKSKGIVGIALGVVFVLVLRFLMHFISGVVIFDTFTNADAWIYSLTYNASYMVPEFISTTLAAIILFKVPAIKRLIDKA
ncbi:MAG: energy-coupled thiamine transporter ThiT [Clostridia bacterium]|nr:energy-coupled thiamine transporter ThiT [Clostridia bacterium]